jgi:hypothetical protein
MRLSFVRPLPPLTASSYVLHHLSVDKWQQAQRPQDAEDSRDDHTKGNRKKGGHSGVFHARMLDVPHYSAMTAASKAPVLGDVDRTRLIMCGSP